jgi:hypothetical protein
VNIILIIIALFLITTSPVQAVSGSTFDDIASQIGLNGTMQGPLGGILSAFLPILFPIAGMVVFLYLIYGGYELMLSGGDPKKTAAGKQVITNALMGFLILFLAYWIVRAIGAMLGSQQILAPFGS